MPLALRPRSSSRRPWAVWGLCVLLVAAFVLGRAAPGGPPAAPLAARAALPADAPPLATLLTHLLAHGSALHLALNLLLLLAFGPEAERRLGALGVLALALACGLAGGLAFVALTGEGTLGGASAAALGLLGAQLALRPTGRVLVLVWVLVVWVGEVPVWLLAALLALLDVAALLALPEAGGLLAGALAGLLLRRRAQRRRAALRL